MFLNKDTNWFDIVGVMSGTSLDGLDVALCRFFLQKETYSYEILHAITLPYDEELKNKLSTAHLLSVTEFYEFHNEFGRYIGKTVYRLIKQFNFQPCCIGSHGHTVLHQPHKGLTLQIGNGAHIAAETGIDTVCDFRVMDVALGGQGAPLVPFGDIYLFSKYEAALNMGGFSNITFSHLKPPVAFDICPLNIVLNALAQKLGHQFDPDGMIAASGKIDETLSKELSDIFTKHSVSLQSLSREWVENFIHPILQKYSIPAENMLRTYSEIAAQTIAATLNKHRPVSCIITGGGTYNKFVVNLIKQQTSVNIIIPDDMTIQFKEALIFAFLALKRYLNEINILADITHAQKSSCSGVIWKG